MEYSFLIEENFPDKIEEFDKKLRLLIPEVKSWSYSYDTKVFTVEIDKLIDINELKEVVKKCL